MYTSKYITAIVICVLISLILVIIKIYWDNRILNYFKLIFENEIVEVISATNYLTIYTSSGGEAYTVEIYENGLFQRSEARQRTSHYITYNSYSVAFKGKNNLDIVSSCDIFYTINQGSVEINQLSVTGNNAFLINEDPIYLIKLEQAKIDLENPNSAAKFEFRKSEGFLPKNLLITKNSLVFWAILPLLLINLIDSKFSENINVWLIVSFAILIGLCFFLQLFNANGIILMLMAFLLSIFTMPLLLSCGILPYFAMYYLKFGPNLLRKDAV